MVMLPKKERALEINKTKFCQHPDALAEMTDVKSENANGERNRLMALPPDRPKTWPGERQEDEFRTKLLGGRECL